MTIVFPQHKEKRKRPLQNPETLPLHARYRFVTEIDQKALRSDFAQFLKDNKVKIIKVAREVGINVQTLYNWRASGQKLSEKKAVQLRAYLDKYKQ